MSFSNQVKNELCRYEEKTLCCLRAQCYGMWLLSKSFSFGETGFVTENINTARKMMELTAQCAGLSPELVIAFSRKRKQAYKVRFTDIAQKNAILSFFGHSSEEVNLRLNRANLEEDCCYAAFLRGAFLVSASIMDPEKGYHIEFQTQHPHLSNDLVALLRDMEQPELTPAVTVRQGKRLVYLKDSMQIEEFLTALGATAASMELMQVKMMKEARNQFNRKANFETANMDKTYSAAARQIAAIARIHDARGLSSLPDELEELARFRLENPEMSLRELSAHMGLTRSGVNHRLKKLQDIAETLAKDG